jgi:hypothetical protein
MPMTGTLSSAGGVVDVELIGASRIHQGSIRHARADD